MRLIDAHALLKELHKTYLYDGDARGIVYKKIEEQPTIEPEIIRCKDCKHHVLHPRMGVLWCTLLHSDMGDNQFCSYAERRSEEE